MDVLNLQNLSVGYFQGKHNSRIVLTDIDETIKSGEFIALLGPNGTGKSTLIKTITGSLREISGEIYISGKLLRKYKPIQLAQEISVVLTNRVFIDNISVFRLVALGRHPHTNWFGTLDSTDMRIVGQVIRDVGIEDLVRRNFNELSDGERQKVMIARALVQDTPLIFLDEPTAHLDLPSKVEIMNLLRKVVNEKKISILIATHELELSLQTASKLWLTSENGCLYSGIPESLILDGTFEKIFKREGVEFDLSTGSFKLTRKYIGKIRIIGNGIVFFWTSHAFQRLGYEVVNTEIEKVPTIEVKKENSKYLWIFKERSNRKTFSSLSNLIQDLV